jgi:(1->4)-alpha-D-glucan 1-alpha-D-glucosylmutase
VTVPEFHEANLKRPPRGLLTTFTHDTKRSADVRARLAALTWVPSEWAELVRKVGVDGDDASLALQTVVGAWPLTPERLDAYLEKALREGKRTSSWIDPDVAAERRVQAYARGLLESRDVERFVELVRPLGRRVALGQLLLKLTSPGVPDIYQGDELEALSLVDPDNRRPVDWARRGEALEELRRGAPPTDDTAKLYVTWKTLELRARREEAFAGSYEAVDLGPDVCAFDRGGVVLVVVPVRDVPLPAVSAEWRPVLAGDLGVGLFERG